VSVRSYYDEGAILLSDDITMLPDLLLGLNCIDFRLNMTLGCSSDCISFYSYYAVP